MNKFIFLLSIFIYSSNALALDFDKEKFSESMSDNFSYFKKVMREPSRAVIDLHRYIYEDSKVLANPVKNIISNYDSRDVKVMLEDTIENIGNNDIFSMKEYESATSQWMDFQIKEVESHMDRKMREYQRYVLYNPVVSKVRRYQSIRSVRGLMSELGQDLRGGVWYLKRNSGAGSLNYFKIHDLYKLKNGLHFK